MRVLVVEDSRSLADVLVEGLRDQGMAVDVAHDGLEAAAKLDVNAYDVVVLDRDLPGIHGDALCQMITERDDRVMVLMLTAAGEPGDRVSGLILGADDYLAKPFHFPELVLRIQALARRQPSARAPDPARGGVELDPVRRTVDPGRPQLDLSVKEFGVLEALLRATPGLPAARRTCSSRSGTSTPTRSPTRSRSPSAGCAASSATRRSSRPRPASATGCAPETDGPGTGPAGRDRRHRPAAGPGLRDGAAHLRAAPVRRRGLGG